MFKNYLTVAFRALRKRPGYTFINIAGLAVGLACCMLIFLYIVDELQFDRFHDDADQIYRLIEEGRSPDQGTTYSAQTAGAPGLVAVNQIPGVEASVRMFHIGSTNIRQGEVWFYERNFVFTDASFFEVFDFEFVQGDPQTALAEPNSIILTESTARKYFGDADPLGQSMTTDFSPTDELTPLTVTGVLRDLPHNSHLQFDFLLPATLLKMFDFWERYTTTWDYRSFATYVKLSEGTDPDRVGEALSAAASEHWDPSETNARLGLALQPLTDIHFGSADLQNEYGANNGDPVYLYIFGAIALFIVLIACINYMNLATARSFSRAKEVGLRKVIGAHRAQLIRQFLSESMLTVLLASVLAFALIQVLLPGFNTFTDKTITLGSSTSMLIGSAFLALVIVVGLMAGSYPALYLSRFRPASVLKGSLRSGQGPSLLRRGLVVTQFALSITMIVATVVVFTQLRYVQTKDLGFNEEHLVVIDINSGVARSNFETMKAEFRQSPAVRSVSASSRVPGEWKNLTDVQVIPEGSSDNDRRFSYFIASDESFLETFEVDLTEGRMFEQGRLADSAAVLLNETAVEAFGFDREDVIGRRVRIPVNASSEEALEAEVIGVVRDFHVRSLHESIAPLVLAHWNNPIYPIDYFTVRVEGQNLAETIDFLEAAHYSVDPETLFELNFLDQRLGDFYVREQRIGQLFGIAAGLAILIACLGLFGLAAYMAERRTKEIGVRKVLGASVSGLALLLSKDFVRLTALAFLIATPVAYVLMSRWLDNFAYHVTLGPGVFLLSGGLALLIALLTVSYQAIKAARSNPVDSLRYE